MKKLLALSLMACLSFGSFAYPAADSDPGGTKDAISMVKTMDSDAAVAASEPVMSGDADMVLIGTVSVSDSIFPGHDEPGVTGQAAQVEPTEHERTCQLSVNASPREYAMTSHTETHKPASDGRHWTSWRLQG